MFVSSDRDPPAALPAATVPNASRSTEGGLVCMVIGFSEHRRPLLASAAAAAGWTVIDLADAKAARIQLLRQPPAMVVVDVEDASGSAPEVLKSLLERVSTQRDVLIVMCGNEGNAVEEIWARQLGVWLYLPGVIDDSEVTDLLEEGSQVAVRRATAAQRHVYFPEGKSASA